jgi:hypothetical protein
MAVNLLMSAKRSRANMADDRRGPPSEGRPRPLRPQPPREERPFDVWLNRQLHAMYDDIAREPLPRDVVELIERDGREAAAATAPPADGPAQQPPSGDRPQGDKD